MKPQNLHAHEDRLLDFIYGELPPLEARAVESHVEGCARCTELLAGMRGVRTTMAQLPSEPAPEMGLESLLAYAQQAARNAAAGPAPKPTWWRRWLVPAMGVAAVTVFGVLSTQVNKSLHLKEEIAAQSAAEDAKRQPVADPAPKALPPAAQQKLAPQAQMAQAPSSPPAEGYAQGAVAGAKAEPTGEVAALPAPTPPPPAPAAKLDRSWLAKEAPRSKPSLPGRKGSRSDWSNAGSAGGYGENKDADLGTDEELASAETSSKKAKTRYESDRRDAMTQAGPFPKPKPILAGTAPAEPAQADVPAPPPPAPNQPAMNEPAAGDGLMAEREAQVQQQAPSQGSLRIGGSRSRNTETASRGKAAEDSSSDFDDLFGSGKKQVAQREQREPSGAGAPVRSPAPAAAAPSPMPSVSTSTPSTYRSMPSTRDEAKVEEKQQAAGSAELSKQADAAMRSGNRVREAELLRQALDAGATGKERLGLLNRLCAAEFAAGNRQAAFEACTLVLEEDPRSGAAQVARNRLRREGLEDTSGKAGTGSRGPAKAAPVDKMEAPAQAQ